MHMGPDFVLVNISVDFKDNETANSVESVISEIDKTIKADYPQIKRIFIEAEARKIANKI
jgi:divalent metal cation (Fe/Co/Zn/Cd) transporter